MPRCAHTMKATGFDGVTRCCDCGKEFRYPAPSPSLAGASDADRDERTAICFALGCIDKPGVPLKFVQDLQRRLAESYARNDELIRTWDRASPTERQELDRMRRGWGPSSPTERVRRKTDVAACVQALGSALTELSVSEEDADDVPEEAQAYLDAAYDRVEKAYKAAIAVSHAIQDEPGEWPDIKAAEERGALAAEANLLALARMYGRACGALAEYRSAAVEWQGEQADYKAVFEARVAQITTELTEARADAEATASLAGKLDGEKATLVARVAQLEAALKPFAEAVKVNDGNTLSRMRPDTFAVWTATGSWSAPASVTLGHLRAAASALNPEGETNA